MKRFEVIILSALLLLSSFACKPPEKEFVMPKDAKNPQVTIEMNTGEKIVIELRYDIAPNTVLNFISVVKNGYLDGTIFHRVSPTFMIQGGEMTNGSLGYTIKGEFAQNGFENNLPHTKGVISMARTNDMNSATTQFFLMTATSTYLDGKYAAFGSVISGIEVVDAIAASEWSVGYGDGTGKPAVEQVMKKVTVDTFGVDYPEPEKYGD